MSTIADRLIGVALLSFGTLGIVLSDLYKSTVLAFISLTLVFWGCLLLLVLPGKYVKSEVMDIMASSSLSALNQIIADSNLQGTPIYIPVPKEFYLPYQIGLKNEFVYIPQRDIGIETAVEQAFTNSPKGLRIVPPGLGLADAIEKKSKIDFRNANLNSIGETLLSAVTRELEIAANVVMRLEGNMVHTAIENPVCEDLCKEATKLERICPHIGCPLSSSIACILTRVTNKPVTIEGCSTKTRSIETTYRII